MAVHLTIVRLWVQIPGSETFCFGSKFFEIIVAWDFTHVYLDEIKQPSFGTYI